MCCSYLSSDRISAFVSRIIEESGMMKNQKILAAIALLSIMVIFYLFSLKSPYHLDTAQYMKTSADFLETGKIDCYYETRCMVAYIIFPFYQLIGPGALPIVIAASASLAFLMYFIWTSRIFGKGIALASTLFLLAIPASIMTITHLKEDFIALFFLFAGFCILMEQKAWKKYLSAIFVAMAALSKETTVIFIPFYFAYAYLNVQDLKWANDLFSRQSIMKGLKEIFLMAAFLAATILLINPVYPSNVLNLSKSPYLGQFLGVASPLIETGVNKWIYGIGGIFFFLQFTGAYLFIVEKDIKKRMIIALFFLQGIAVGIFLINNTVMNYRHFIWTSFVLFPLMSGAIWELLCKKIGSDAGLIGMLALAVVSVSLIIMVYPVVEFRSQFNPVEEFYTSAQIPANSILLGMDSCSLASYYTCAPCYGHAADATKEQAEEFENFIDSALSNGTDVYVLPDVASYDSYGNIQKSLSKYSIKTVYSGWYEDYHAMNYGYSEEDFISHSKNKTGCSVYPLKTAYEMVGDQKVEYLSLYTVCADGASTKIVYPVIGDRILTSLYKESLQQITGKNST